MCGVNGILTISPLNNLHERIEKMNFSISHRGPDHDGILVEDCNFAFGHRRLSIIDLDVRSNQPMLSNSGRFVLVFNGEIFNFEELKRELDYDFRTNSDTEVILASAERKSIDWFLKKANGMFAFVLYDRLEKRLYLVRDRFGIKPLFYYVDEEYLVFSSEIKGILSSGLVDARFREESIDEYLGNRHVREPFTFFENIYQVESSTYLVFDEKFQSESLIYWELPRLNFSKKFDERRIIEESKIQVSKAVNRWLLSDVKVGAYLSGGLDSSLTTAIIASDGRKVDTYTIGFKEEGYNEFKYAGIVAKKYKTRHHEFVIDKNDYNNEWDRLIWFKDAPLGVPNEIPLSIMSTNLSEDITVVISGEGADELFGGYGRIFRLPFDFKNIDGLADDFYSEFVDEYEYVPRKIRDKYLLTRNSRDYFDSKLRTEFKNFKNEENVFRFFHNYHIKGLLHRVDVTTMQTSVEARPPFLDHELVEYVYKQIPYDLKLKWNSISAEKEAMGKKSMEYSEKLDTPKYVLKQVAKSYLPDDVIDRKKVGFPVPLSNWFPDLVDQAENILIGADWLRQHDIQELIADVKNEMRSGQLLWMFLNIEMFKRKYFQKNWKW